MDPGTCTTCDPLGCLCDPPEHHAPAVRIYNHVQVLAVAAKTHSDPFIQQEQHPQASPRWDVLCTLQ
eukprot:6462925-Amphidinium_carterae.1